MPDHPRAYVSALRLQLPTNRRQLAAWVDTFLGMHLPDQPQCVGHHSPLDYLEHSFLENPDGPADAIVWACRGGGKTMIGAAATLLDLLFKPGIQIRILGGSFEQSEKMYAYLRTLVERHFRDALEEPPTQRRLAFTNGSRVEVLAQSDTSVRGQRVQKLRCDEVELFQPEVWEAAQLTTRSHGRTPSGARVRGAIEAFSTMHRPAGLMQQLLEKSAAGNTRKIFAWCVWDVLEKCPDRRSCDSCPLWDACQGRAKNVPAPGGFVKIDDVIAMRSRVSAATWQHEMLCHRPRHEDAVFPAFHRDTHLRAFPAGPLAPGADLPLDTRTLRLETLVAGVDFGFRHAFVCLWIAMLRDAGRRAVWVVDELVTREQTLERNAAAMRRSPWAAAAAAVYCDNAGGQINGQTGLSDERILRDAGFVTRKRFMRIDEGLLDIADLLAPAEGPPRFFIDPRCTRLIAAMEGYRRNPAGDPIKDGTHDHLIDALRYALATHDRAPSKLVMANY